MTTLSQPDHANPEEAEADYLRSTYIPYLQRLLRQAEAAAGLGRPTADGQPADQPDGEGSSGSRAD